MWIIIRKNYQLAKNSISLTSVNLISFKLNANFSTKEKAMISFSQMNLRNVVAKCLTFSLLILPSFASAQSGTTVESVTPEPIPTLKLPGVASESGGSMTKDGAGSTTKDGAGSTTKDGAGSTTKDGAGSTTKDGAGSTTKDGAGSTTKDGAGSTTKDGAGSTTKDGAGSTTKDEAESEQTLEERRAAWMAELEQLTFAELVKRIRVDEHKINHLYINIPLGDPVKQREYQNAIQAFQNEIVELNRLLEPAAVEAFRSDPGGSRAASNKVFEVLASKLAPQGRNSRYNPEEGLRLVDTILEIKGGDIGVEPGVRPLPEDRPFMDVIYQGYVASYGSQNFERAEEFLTRLENMDIGLDPKLRETFDATIEDWKKEELIRAEEARVDNLPRVKLETTEGDVLIELFENEAPNTVANFIKLTQEGYYDGLEFFQVVPGGYARSGCTANDGTTHPGYRIRNEFENGRSHFAGTVVMQNDGENTAGSQFIILHRPDPNLKEKVVSFGRVIEGLDIVYGFKTVNRIRHAGGEATVINKATVLRGPKYEREVEMLEDSSELLLDDPSRIIPSTGSVTRPLPSGSATRPSGSSARPTPRPSGSYSRP